MGPGLIRELSGMRIKRRIFPVIVTIGSKQLIQRVVDPGRSTVQAVEVLEAALESSADTRQLEEPGESLAWSPLLVQPDDEFRIQESIRKRRSVCPHSR